MSSTPNPIHNAAAVDSAPMTRYVIDPRLSRFTVQAFASGVLSAFGHNPHLAIRDYQGEVRWNGTDSAALHFVAKSASLNVTDTISDKDRREIERQMNAEVLESQRYPEIIYECSRISIQGNGGGQLQVTLNGDLTLHGVTNPQAIVSQVSILGDTLRAFGEFTLRQTDYGIRLVSALAGALKVKDELKFEFNLVARKQE